MSLQDKIQDYVKGLEKTLAGVEPFETVHKNAKIARAHMALGVAAAAILFVFFGIGASLVTNLVGFIYPAYMSFKAIESEETADDTLWLTYWVVYATFNVVESFSDIILSWIPFYYMAKLGFIVWCMHPATRGAVTIYKSVISPFMKQHEAAIDGGLRSATSAATTATSSATRAGARFVSENSASIVQGVASGVSAAQRVSETKKEE